MTLRRDLTSDPEASLAERLAYENGQLRQAGQMMLGLLDTIWRAAMEHRAVDAAGLKNRIEFYESYFESSAPALVNEEAERIADNMEDQRREPDKTLCNVQSLRRAIANARTER